MSVTRKNAGLRKTYTAL